MEERPYILVVSPLSFFFSFFVSSFLFFCLYAPLLRSLSLSCLFLSFFGFMYSLSSFFPTFRIVRIYLRSRRPTCRELCALVCMNFGWIHFVYRSFHRF